MELGQYVIEHTERGECRCGQCIDRGDKPDPEGHTADLIFFPVAAIDAPEAETFRQLTRECRGEFAPCDPFDGEEHNYIELGAWIGDQGLALRYMGLGALLGLFELTTPRLVMPDLDEKSAMELAARGLLTVHARSGSAR